MTKQAGKAPPAGFGGIHGAGAGLGAGLLCDPDAGRRADGGLRRDLSCQKLSLKAQS